MTVRTIAGALVFGLAAIETAGATEIYPTAVTLDRARPTGSLRIRNDGPVAATYGISGLRWTQAGGDDVYSPDDDFVATPPILTLDAGEEGIVRVGLLSKEAADGREKAYRLLIEDVTQHASAASTGLNVVVQILVPVFLKPDKTDPSIRFAASAKDDGRLCITGVNSGDSHVKTVWIADRRAPAKNIPAYHYFLAGSSGEFCVEAPPALLSSQSLTVGLTSAYQAGVTLHDIRTSHFDAAPPSGD